MTQWGLDTLFNPAKRHMDEEKRRLQATRQQVGDTSGGKRIDLESGKVRIGKTAGAAEDADAEETDAAEPAAESAAEPAAEESTKADGHEAANAEPPGEKKAKKTRPAKQAEPSAAAVRAAQRRGRQPR